METKSQIREFLTSRRANITPEQAGLTAYGPRRVPGLRREEVAVLAGVSVDYYTRMERGNLAGVSESVLEALSRGLQLDEAERSHLFDLARAVQPTTAKRRSRTRRPIRPSVQRVLDSLTGAPALVQNGRGDILATNSLARALFSDLYVDPLRPPNFARFVFLSPRANDFYGDWEKAADDTVAILRIEAGRDPHDRDLSDLIGELSTRSHEFRTRWAAHNVRIHRTGEKEIRHRGVGDLRLTYEMLELAADPGLAIVTYTAEPGSKSEEALILLGSWASTLDTEVATGGRVD